MPEYKTISSDETQRAKAAIRTAETTDKIADTLHDMTDKINRLSDALDAERQLRLEADKKQEKSGKRLERIAWITLIANWGALIFAILTFFFR